MYIKYIYIYIYIYISYFCVYRVLKLLLLKKFQIVTFYQIAIPQLKATTSITSTDQCIIQSYINFTKAAFMYWQSFVIKSEINESQ
jgi:hypothetical protein